MNIQHDDTKTGMGNCFASTLGRAASASVREQIRNFWNNGKI